MFHIVLYHPEIPANTGNIIRLCANTGSILHLISPLGFALDDKRLKRAGLDYHDKTQLLIHPSFNTFLERHPPSRMFACETGGATCYAETVFCPNDVLVFGSETTGLPQEVLERIGKASVLSIPMCHSNRSINLSNSVAIVLFEAWRQNHFTNKYVHPI